MYWLLGLKVLVGEHGAAPAPGLTVGGNWGPHLALEARLNTLLFFTVATAGLKGFLRQDSLSPYGFIHGGVFHGIAFMGIDEIVAPV